MLLKQIRHSQPVVFESGNHPRIAALINEFAASAEISVEVVDDLAFEVYVYDLQQRIYFREFTQDQEAAVKDPKRTARLVPRHILGDEYGGYERLFTCHGGGGSDEALLDGIYVVRKGEVPGEFYRALRLDPPTSRSLIEALLLFLKEDEEDAEDQRADGRKRHAAQQAKWAAKLA